MKKSFALGAIAGATSLAIAVPVIAQVAGAQNTATDRPAPTQECVQALAARSTDMLAGFDAEAATRKAALTAHRDALTAAAALTDDTAREEALKKAQEDLRAAMEAAHQAKDGTQNDAVKAACGSDFGPMHGRGGPMMKGDMKGKLREKLGMTEDELKAALDSGKTIEEIAAEKGVELPSRPEGRGHGRGGMMRFMHDNDNDDQ